ncbi:Gfo/Idh/MocA family protein [Rhizobium herbae]|uniref:Dehydrogenase n=1 Tax=Rhizobium herbae TaxID=508661 RepID=A0ABS4ETM1_9HYPH|nr:Gfo/Idh/MocA family oxidoreductase [Rhizobium herbae]MBP1861141.1 putative dehydrogenase [Rhizobium herbae]
MDTTDKNRLAAAATVKWAVLGTGAIASTFADDIRLAENAELVAVCSRTVEAATNFSQRVGPLRIIADIEALAGDPLVDAVYLATPNTAHFDQAWTLLNAGKPVLIEKPLVTMAAQARSLAELAANQQTFAMEGLWTVFLPAIDRVRSLLADNTIGAITGIRAELAYAKTFDGNSRFFSQVLGGGSLLDLGIYPIALVLALFGSPQSIAGRWLAAPTGVDMSADIRLGFGAFEASISCGFDRNGGNRFIIEGEAGRLVIDAPFLRANRILVTRNRLANYVAAPPRSGRLSRAISKIARRLPLPGLTVHEHGFPGSGLQFEIEAASKAILEGKREHPLMPLGASIAALDIIETILAQRAS